jgi:ribulose-phosphate 3-epimerase
MQIALSINARDAAEARDLALRAPRIMGAGGMVHMDVHDASFQGVMVPQSVKTEVHLMVRDWESRLTSWLEAGVFRAIIPAEYMDKENMHRAQEVATRYGAHIMPSFSYADETADFSPYVGFSAFQILAVPAGKSGQAFDMRAIEKIKALRAAFLDAILEVDGGMTPVFVARAKDAGADIVVSSSCIWGAESPHEAYEQLSRI